ncbi:MFS transporter [Rhodopila sp.]|jgi:MFS family permease|uniref:MFS transporter n=1 Tax=Rhodopila sp. TaxID=2480087 RepID=UPI002C8CFF79|nr:MFS transporter [Rhodopila sp.]HVZ09161.1 MFS transporter [Rhodopila sp.]
MTSATPRWPAHLPFYFGWVIIGVAFVTMAIGVTARTAFSLLLPPLIQEFGWDRGEVAGAFSFGFLVSAFLSPIAGRMMDRQGPRVVILAGVALMSSGLLLAPWIARPWQLYLTLGVLVGCGTNLAGYTVQSLYVPNWFVRRRGLAMGLAFSGVGIGAVILLPWLQSLIVQQGWRAASHAMGLLALIVLAPLNLLVWRRPTDVGLLPDGVRSIDAARPGRGAAHIVDPAWTGIGWTLRRAIRTGRFWWLSLGFCMALFVWYGVQVHQTKYLVEVGFSPLTAAWALGIVSLVGIPGQIGLGALSDRIGREAVWAIACLGFAICYAALIALEHTPSPALLYLMVLAQGCLGYGLTSVMGPIVLEIFEGPHYGSIMGTINIAAICGGALGPWVTGLIHDRTGSYQVAFLIAILCCAVSAASVWMASPRKIRSVPGRARVGR